MTANLIASSVVRSSHSMLQPSVYWRIGDEPMNMPTSIGSPVRWLISTIGVMSAIVVRAAQLARTFSFGVDDLARQALDVADDVRAGAGQADVGGVDAELVDQVEDLDLLAMVGVRTDGDCSPSRSVSSSSMTRGGLAGAPILFQS